VGSDGAVYIAGPSIVFKLDASGMLTRIAGSGHYGYSGDGGPARAALLGFPRAVPHDPIDFSDVVGSLATDASGNLYIADFFNNRVRKVTPNGLIFTAAGGGPAFDHTFRWPGGVAVDSTGTLYVTGVYDGLWQITPDSAITALIPNDCGRPQQPGVCVPYGVAADARGKVYVADTGNCRIVAISPDGTIAAVAGDERPSHGLVFTCGFSGDGGPATTAAMNDPYSVAVDTSGNLYIADTYNNRIRKVAKDGVITTVAGRGPSYGFGYKGGYSGDGGPATDAELNLPHGVAVDAAGAIYIADTSGSK
jgi:sugar lactone lactonase YvrE